MDFEHYGKRFGFGAHEDVFEDEDDKFHGGEIVVVQYDFEEFRLLELGFAFGQDVRVASDIGKFRHKNKKAKVKSKKAKENGFFCLLPFYFLLQIFATSK